MRPWETCAWENEAECTIFVLQIQVFLRPLPPLGPCAPLPPPPYLHGKATRKQIHHDIPMSIHSILDLGKQEEDYTSLYYQAKKQLWDRQQRLGDRNTHVASGRSNLLLSMELNACLLRRSIYYAHYFYGRRLFAIVVSLHINAIPSG